MQRIPSKTPENGANDDHFSAPPVKRAAAHNCVEKMQLCVESDRKGERQDEKASEAGRKDVTGRSQGFGQLSDQLSGQLSGPLSGPLSGATITGTLDR